MAEADQLLPLGAWQSEGRTLGAILQALLRPAAWSDLLEHTGELQTQDLTVRRWAVIRVHPPFSPPEWIKEFLELWNSGQLIAKGRRGDLLAAPVEISPPSVGYDIEVADFTRSVIRDPAYSKKLIYDLRFFSKSKPEMEPRAKNSTKNWIVTEARRMKAAGEIKANIRITDLAKQPEASLKEAARDVDKPLKTVTWRHIRNELPAWGLWPIELLK